MLLIQNANVVTWNDENQIIENSAVLVEEGKIKDIGDPKGMDLSKDYESLDASGQYLLPGNICAHTHFYGAYSRGLAIPGSAPEAFPQILSKLWWSLDKALDEDSVRASTLIHLVDAVKHGTTTVFDHHASPNFISGSLDVIADAVAQSGLRASLCYEVTDRDGLEKSREGRDENLRFIDRIHQGDNAGGLLSATFGLHASLTISENTLKQVRNFLPDGMGVHVHVAEHEVDEYDSLEKTGKRVIERLYQHNLLGEDSIIVHAVHISALEMQLLRETKTWVTHQPRSNMNNAVGLPRVEEMLEMGIPVVLGNDGFSQTHWEEMKTAYLVHKLWHRDPRRMNGMDVIQMAVKNNADMASHFFGQHIGKIEVGASADLILVDYHPPTPLTSGNLPWHILFGFNESMVTGTIVAGKVLMNDRELLTLDEEKIMTEALKLAPEVWTRYQGFAEQVN
ncbi:MAG: putative aminohydrolase SsnA [Anaerolineales bacterium]|nr:putative aminohydrolase SsnA [Anaerolineales bacterium]